MTDGINPEDMALFKRYEVSEIAKRTGYSEYYVFHIKQGSQRIRDIFRFRVAKAFGQPEEELFSPATQTDQ